LPLSSPISWLPAGVPQQCAPNTASFLPVSPFFVAPQAAGRQLVFLANVDPVDAVRALHGLDPETTLVVIVRWGVGALVVGWGACAWKRVCEAMNGLDPETTLVLVVR